MGNCCGKIENLLKAAEIILFFLKKSSPPLPNSKKRQKKSGRNSGHQGGKTARKWLDYTVKPCLKIGWRNRQFSAIQQKRL